MIIEQGELVVTVKILAEGLIQVEETIAAVVDNGTTVVDQELVIATTERVAVIATTEIQATGILKSDIKRLAYCRELPIGNPSTGIEKPISKHGPNSYQTLGLLFLYHPYLN